MRKCIVIIMICLSCFTLVSCSNSSLLPHSSVPTTDDPKPDSRVTLEFWHTYSDQETLVFDNKVLPLFEKAYPNIKIHAVRKDYTNQLKDNILAGVADNIQPDIMRIDMIWVPELAQHGALVDLSGTDGFEQIRNQFIGSLIRTNLYRDKYYGLPVNANTKAAIFNVKRLKQAGLDKPPKTFDELIQAVKRIQQAEPDFYGIGICCSNGWGMLPYFWTFGGQLTDANYTHASGYLNNSDSIAAITKIKQLYKEHIINPSPSIQTGGDTDNWSGILKGKLLMIDEAHWFYTVNSTGADKDLLKDTIIGTIPSDVRSGTSVIGGENLVMFKASKLKKEAWQFMKWMVTEEPQSIMATTGLIPTIKNMKHKENLNPLFTPYIQQMNSALPRPSTPAWSNLDNVFARMIERILTDEKPIKAEIDDATKKIDALLAEH